MKENSTHAFSSTALRAQHENKPIHPSSVALLPTRVAGVLDPMPAFFGQFSLHPPTYILCCELVQAFAHVFVPLKKRTKSPQLMLRSENNGSPNFLTKRALAINARTIWITRPLPHIIGIVHKWYTGQMEMKCVGR